MPVDPAVSDAERIGEEIVTTARPKNRLAWQDLRAGGDYAAFGVGSRLSAIQLSIEAGFLLRRLRGIGIDGPQ